MKRLRTSQRFKLYKEARRALSAAYPNAFPLKGRRPPLKVGILRDIVSEGSHGLSAAKVRLFLSIWTSSSAYLESMVRRRPRVGLDGIPCGVVEPSHALEAETCLSARRERSRAFDRAA